jgi:tetratricopeptide (TPR) repeat protein
MLARLFRRRRVVRRSGFNAAAAAIGLSLAVMVGSAPALADTTVLGGGQAALCSQAAMAVAKSHEDRGRRVPLLSGSEALQACDDAIKREVLKRRDLAATHVNRGILRMGKLDVEGARADFERAQSLMPDLPEAYANRGAALIIQGQYREGVAEIGRGLALGAAQPEKSYFNRAIGHEALDDPKSAYFDYLKAAELKPEWGAPQRELARFTVSRR